MTDDTFKFHDALNAAGFEYAALSCNGVNLFGDRKSIDAAKTWMHEAGTLPWFRSEVLQLRSTIEQMKGRLSHGSEQGTTMNEAIRPITAQAVTAIQGDSKIPPLSHSFLVKWDQCPRQAHHIYVLKDIPKEDSEALRWGNQVHKAMEKRVAQQTPLPEPMKHWEPLAAQLDGRGAKAELMLGMKLDGSPCGFFDTDVELRGKIDVLVAYNATAVLFDWKTGKRKEDAEELEIHAVLLKAHKPHLQNISGRYVWLKDNVVGQRHELSHVVSKLSALQARAADVQTAFNNGWFPPQQGPLCPWCRVKTCEFNNEYGK